MEETLPETNRTPPKDLGTGTRFFLWCAGSDRELLETPAEITKQAGLGTLVLVPAVLAAFAMTYAVSTLTDGWTVPALAGGAWALIVFCFDRYVVSTFRKSPSLWKDLASPVFLVRLLLAGFIGILVAHPLVLLYFDDSIEARLDAERSATLQAVDGFFEPRFEAARAELSNLRDELEAREQRRLEAQTILMKELGGVDSEQTTGRYGRGIAAEAQEDLVGMATEGLTTFRNDLPAREEGLRQRLKRLEAERRMERAAIPQARDYIARSRVLEVLAAESPAISTVRWFLILFFVFVDTLPVLFKAFTPRGPYDQRLALQELRIAKDVDAGEESFRTVHTKIDEAGRRGRNSPSTVDDRGLPGLYQQLVDDLSRQRNSLREVLRGEEEAAATLGSPAQSDRHREILERVDATGARVARATLDRFEEVFLGDEIDSAPARTAAPGTEAAAEPA